MEPELSKIKILRRQLGLTQTQLAKAAEVSQSLIAKIESGKIDPTFTKAKRIFDALDSLTTEKALKAKDIMSTRIISISSNADIKEGIRKMRHYDISQLPVLQGKKCIGLITESSILNALRGEGGKKNVEHVKEAMQECPPIISINTSIGLISELLKYSNLVLVADEGEFKGVITKSDIIKGMYAGK